MEPDPKPAPEVPQVPSTVKVRGRSLSACSHGSCRSYAVFDFSTCWSHLTAAEERELIAKVSEKLRKGSDLAKVVLTGAVLDGLDFSGVDLSEALLARCSLRKCKFIEADLKGAFLAGADLEEADLTRANLHSTVFTEANLRGVSLLAYSISFGRIPVNLDMDSFGSSSLFSRPQINEDEPALAFRSYQALKRHFISEADYDSASWASYSERLMHRKLLWMKRAYPGWASSLLFGSASGYGEKPNRVVITACLIVLLFALFFEFFKVAPPAGWQGESTWFHSLNLSMATFCSYSFPDTTPVGNNFSKLLINAEAFLGVFVLGLFIFTLTNRHVAR